MDPRTTAPPPADDTGGTVALRRGLDLLRLLSREGPLGVDELVERSGLRPDAVERLVETLALHGYVTRSGAPLRVQVGSVIDRLSDRFLSRLPVLDIARAVAQELADRHGVVVSLRAPVAAEEVGVALLVCQGRGAPALGIQPGSTAAAPESATEPLRLGDAVLTLEAAWAATGTAIDRAAVAAGLATAASMIGARCAAQGVRYVED